MATEKVKVIKIDTEPGKKSVKEMRDRLKELKDVLVQTEQGTEEYAKAMKEAADISHDLKDMQAELAASAMDFGQVANNCTNVIKGMVGGLQSAQAVMTLFGAESEDVVKAMQKMQASMAIIQGLTAMESGFKSLNRLVLRYTASTEAATVATKALKTVMQPKWLLAITAAISAIVLAYNKLTKASREAKKAQEEFRQEYAKIQGTVGGVVAQFNILQRQYLQLKTQAEKDEWIKNNTSEFNKLGISVNDVNTADKVFIDNTDDVIAALKARAEATAVQQIYIKKMEEAYEEAGDKAVKAGEEISVNLLKITGEAEDKKIEKLLEDARKDIDYTVEYLYDSNGLLYEKLYHLAESGAEKMNQKIIAETTKAVEQSWGVLLSQTQKKADELQRGLGNIIPPTTGSTTGSTTVTNTVDTFKKAYKEMLNIVSQDRTDFEEINFQLETLDKWLGSISNDDKIKHAKEYNAMLERQRELLDNLSTAAVQLINNQKNIEPIEIVEDEEYDEEEERVMALINQYLELTKILKDTKTTELETFNSQMALLNDAYNSGVISHEMYIKRKEQLEKQHSNFLKAEIAKQVNMYVQMANSIGNTLNSFADLYAEVNKENGEVSDEALKRQQDMQIAATVISTLGGIAGMTSSVWTSPDTGEFWARLALQIAMTTEMLASMGVQIAQIKNANKGNSSTPSINTPNVGSIQSPITYTYTEDINSGTEKDNKVYVLEKDITDTTNRVRVASKESRF